MSPWIRRWVETSESFSPLCGWYTDLCTETKTRENVPRILRVCTVHMMPMKCDTGEHTCEIARSSARPPSPPHAHSARPTHDVVLEHVHGGTSSGDHPNNHRNSHRRALFSK